MTPEATRTCTTCYYVRREPPGVHPLMCEREMPTIRTSSARAPGGVCEGGKNWLRNHRATMPGTEHQDQME